MVTLAAMAWAILAAFGLGVLSPAEAGSNVTTSRKMKLIDGHPLFNGAAPGIELRCADLPEFWEQAARASELPARWTIAYLIMGEDDVRSKEAAMWSTGADVFVLTYRTPRWDAIYCPDLRLKKDDRRAFARGRNTLLLAARLQELRQGWAYQYYVFLDSDVEAVAVRREDRRGLVWTRGLRRFHNFLREWEPAVGVPLYENHNVEFVYTHMFSFPMEADADAPRTTLWHDQMFVAIHREAAQVLFPLDAELDMMDAIISQWNMSLHASLMFRGHVLLFKGLQLRNPAHDRDPDQNVQVLMENTSAHVRAKVPQRLQHCVLDPWNAYGLTVSFSSFRARHIRPPMQKSRTDYGLRFQSSSAVMDSQAGERGLIWVHSYYPWGVPAKKKWRYDTATVQTSPSCDDEPEYRNHWWGGLCIMPSDRPLYDWLTCTRYSLRGRAGPYLV